MKMSMSSPAVIGPKVMTKSSVAARVAALQKREAEAGLTSPETFEAFRGQVEAIKRHVLDFLIARRQMILIVIRISVMAAIDA